MCVETVYCCLVSDVTYVTTASDVKHHMWINTIHISTQTDTRRGANTIKCDGCGGTVYTDITQSLKLHEWRHRKAILVSL